ncbi:Gfo/Idh/MocA family oxidoreductase [Dyadobacter sp. CY261]|uniref:Gfo/Idh/MocA family protein n=1 Tax=Dyadobacter sp. CY261 TaxID=2907203 RepID=UPI001F24EDE0|nr:Gfo/Idh/MocA family oxidoreductase [Dyadobacter sp. CY261]MCF0072899.1 Gfo/Idh/MocA family oxidoreductase [Dyadobacter sp. CY261]
MQRRDFIKSGAIVAGSVIIPFSRQENRKKIRLAILGTGNWGTNVIIPSALASGQFDIVALCDVNLEASKHAAEEVVRLGGKRPEMFTSYQQLYQMQGLGAVAIVTPTHWHALHFVAACRAGLHVFLEKPISYDIREGQAMLQAHRQARNVVQVDFPRVKGRVNDEVSAFIASGEAGKIRGAHANIYHHEGRLVEKPIPATIDFDAFCGPAPKSKFLCEPDQSIPMWRGQRAFSRGILFDWGIHYIHNARKVLGLGLPGEVSAAGGIVGHDAIDNPDHLDVRFDFGGLPVTWSHKTWGYVSPDPDRNYGIYYYGEKATIFAGDMGWEVHPVGSSAKTSYGDIRFNPGDPKVWNEYLAMTTSLWEEFAIQIGKNSNDGITNSLEDAYRTTAAVIYADIAYQVKAHLRIDADTMSILNNNEGQKLLKRTYRAPYAAFDLTEISGR